MCLQSIDDKDGVESSSDTITESEQGFMPVYFEPRALRNLQPVDQPDSLAPIIDMKVRSSSLCVSVPATPLFAVRACI